MKTGIIFFCVLILLALDWAALHDILKGSESDYSGEYLVLVASGVIFVALAWQRWRVAKASHG